MNIRNASTEAFPIDTSCWELIDTEGFAYKAIPMCDALRPPRTIDPNSHGNASPGTQVNVILLFPELKSTIQIACLAYWRRRELYSLEISKSKRGALDMANARESLRVDARSARIEECKAYLDHLQQDVQSRLSKTLTRIESEQLARRITKLGQAIERTLLRIKQPDKGSLETLFQVTMTAYQEAVESAQKQAEERKKANQTLEELLRLSPSGFEEYIGDLFEARGYQRVNIRGGSGDQGADILAEKDGERVAIQCKLYKKGIVGPHEVRALIGSLQLTEAQRGILITTSTFSIQAERMGEEAGIEMIGGNKLIELIAGTKANESGPR
jgi:restriction system protein